MVGLLKIPLRLLTIGLETSRRLTWEYHLCSFVPAGSAACQLHLLPKDACISLTLPFRSRKNTAEAMVCGCESEHTEEGAVSFKPCQTIKTTLPDLVASPRSARGM